LKIIEPGKDEPVSREVLWWDGIELAPPRPKQGLISKKWETHQKKEQQRISGDYTMLACLSLLFCIIMTNFWKRLS